jgi:hypothetical protein
MHYLNTSLLAAVSTNEAETERMQLWLGQATRERPRSQRLGGD